MSRAHVIFAAAAFLLLLPVFASQGNKKGAPLPEEIDSRGLKALLSRDSGSVVLVNAWASWCKPCKEEMPDLVALYHKHEKQGLRLVLISADDPELLETDVRRTLDSAGVDFKTYINRDSTEEAFIEGLSASWGGALPATFLYDRSGRQVKMLVGARSMRQLEEAVLPLLRKAP